MRTSNDQNRQGATVVEFALVAPIFLISVFLCVDFARFWMMEAFVENAVFQSARHVSVFGATKAEAEAFASQELALIGIDEFTINITPSDVFGVEQPAINDETDQLEVEIRVEPEELSFLNTLLNKKPLTRNTVTQTNRPF